MDNTNNINDPNYLYQLENTQKNLHMDLPPLPPSDAVGQDVCAIVRLYLAVWDDLSSAQRLAVSQHIQVCPSCGHEQKIFARSTQLVRGMAASEPSPGVDRAVFAAISARSSQSATSPLRMETITKAVHKAGRRRFSLPLTGLIAAVAVVMLAVAFSAYFLVAQTAQAFTLPANLSWNNYVVFSKQTMMSAQGEPYEVISYHDMQAQMTNVETVMHGKLDVEVVAHQKASLGLDKMHRIAQWDANDWMSDTSYFDLTRLREDLQAKKAVYLGKGRFQGQDVYRIRYSDGYILLLDMHYMPVNILSPQKTNGQDEPMFDTVQWLQPSQVSSSMWRMEVPGGFQMGRLPARP